MPTNIPAIQQFQAPDIGNIAVKFQQLKTLRQQGEATQNVAATERMKLERTHDIETKGFALNVLSGVNSPEDLEIARRQFNAQYPEYTDMTDRIMSDYSPRKVEMIRNSLRTETQRLKSEEIKGFAAGSALYQGEKKWDKCPLPPARMPLRFSRVQGRSRFM